MPLRTVVLIAWGVFCVVWVIAGIGAKKGSRGPASRWPTLFAIAVFLALRVVRPHTLEVHGVTARAIGTGVVIAGVAVAIWARIYLGRNWGMPMSQKDDPELVTSGPYRFIRHPIYSGILLAGLGTAFVTTLYVLLGVLAVGGLFVYSAMVEERSLSVTFPEAYEAYRAQTKMLIPFVL